MKNIKGFTLVEVIIAIGLLGILTIGAMKLLGNVSNIEVSVENVSDEMLVNNIVRTVIDHSDHCRISLAGDGAAGSPVTPVSFKKSDVDEDTEGLDIELFYSNNLGDTREKLVMSSTDVTAAKVGKLVITDIKLIMNNGTGYDYISKPSHQDVGTLRVSYTKRVNRKKRELSLEVPVNLAMITDNTGLTTILGCKIASSVTAIEEYEGINQNTFTVDSSTSPVNIDLSSYSGAKFLYMSGQCNCASSSGNVSIIVNFNNIDGSTRSFTLCRSSQDNLRFPASTTFPISSLYTSINLEVASSCGGNSFSEARIIK